MTDSDDTITVSLTASQVRAIRQALHIGLYSFGQVESVLDYANFCKVSNIEIDEQLIPVHPTGARDTVSKITEALMYLED